MAKYFKKFKPLKKYSTNLNPSNKNASFWHSKYKYIIVFHNRTTLKKEHLFCNSRKEAIKEIKRMLGTMICSYPSLFKIKFIDEYQTPYDEERKQ